MSECIHSVYPNGWNVFIGIIDCTWRNFNLEIWEFGNGVLMGVMDVWDLKLKSWKWIF
jgi:hypothetical protein